MPAAPTTRQILEALTAIDQSMEALYNLADEWQEVACENLTEHGGTCISAFGVHEEDCLVCVTFGLIIDLHQSWLASPEIIEPLQRSFYDTARKVMG
jgi:hypothetical protein